jgi:replicative superfamily II helicase
MSIYIVRKLNHNLNFPFKVIGMSATLPNLELLSSWIDAELVVTDFRPVPLIEHICFNGKIFDQFIKQVRDVKVDTLPIQIRVNEFNNNFIKEYKILIC